jgi:hypothetical protein
MKIGSFNTNLTIKAEYKHKKVIKASVTAWLSFASTSRRRLINHLQI